jgi:hypothetical protein
VELKCVTNGSLSAEGENKLVYPSSKLHLHRFIAGSRHNPIPIL